MELGPRRAIVDRIARHGRRSCATRRVGAWGAEQQDRLAERLGTEQGRPLDHLEGADKLEHEGETILGLCLDLDGDEAGLPRCVEGLSEGHQPARGNAFRRCDLGAMTQQSEQVVPTGTNAGDPLREQLPAHLEPVLPERVDHSGERDAWLSHHLREALEHEPHTGLFTWKGVVGKDALAGLAHQTASQADAQASDVPRDPEPPRDPAERELQLPAAATGADAAVEDRGRR